MLQLRTSLFLNNLLGNIIGNMDLTFEKWEDGRWFVDLPDYDEMTAKSMSKSQIANNQLFNWIWRFEIIVENLKYRKGNSHEAIN